MTTATFTDRPAWKIVLLAAFAAVCAYLLHRNLGTHPNVFADEWYYSKMARLQPLGEALVPSYLYLWLFGTISYWGSQFYDSVHIGNIVFFMAAAPFVYLTARTVTSKPFAALLALLSALAPINVYTVYFMPEATYYFGFCVLSWVALTRLHWHWATLSAATGLLLGLMSLVKVHALFLLPALCLFLVYARWTSGGRWLATGLGASAIALACTLAVKYGLGYLLAGDAAFNLFGNFYKGAVNAAGARSKLTLIAPSIVSGRGHLMSLALLLPLPLAMLAYSVLRPPERGQAGKPELLQLYTLLMLGAAAGLTIIFTASLANPGINKEGLRLHLRYYDFVFPLLWMVAAAAIGKPAPDQRPWLRWAIAALMAVVLAFTLVKLPTYELNPVDGPDVFGLNPALWPGRVLLGVDLLVLLLWAAGQRGAAALFVLVALPVSIVAGVTLGEEVADRNRIEQPADRAAAFVRSHVPVAEHKMLTVAGSDVQQLMRTQFGIDADTTLLLLSGGAAIEQYQLPIHNKYLLVLGKHALPAGVQALAQNDEFTLLNMKTNHRPVASVALAAPFGRGLIASAQGLSYAESWGRWSDAKHVVIHFSQPLPRHLRVVLKAQAFAENTELPFVMRVGGRSEHFKLGWMPEEVGLVFETDGATRDLEIEVPYPVAPRKHGQADDRTVGIGISEIEIGELEHKDLAAR
jgi:phosphoglycerol transferase